MVIKFKSPVSSMALGNLVSSMAVALLIVLVLSLDPRGNPKSDENLSDTSGNTAESIPENKSQPANENETASPSLSSSVVAPKPVPTPTPGTVLNLINWKLTLPVDTSHAGNPDEIKQPELATFSLSPYFQLNSAKNGVIFRASVEGVTTSGSSYPRSELREMTNSGKQAASWSSASGTHTMTLRQAITHVPAAKPDVVAGQIHDASDDIIMVRLGANRLFVESGGVTVGELDSNYSLGTVFTVQLVASDGSIKVFYNGALKIDYAKVGSGFFFKAGCYTLSNPSKGDSPGEYGEVVIYDLQVSHS